MAEPITDQPTSDAFGFALKPVGAPGLALLENTSSITITQRWPKCLELLGCWEYKNHYKIRNETGDELMMAKEESSCCSRYWCKNQRPFVMPVTDKDGNEVMRFERPLRCMGACCNCCYPNLLQSLTVTSNGQFLGRIQEPARCCDIALEIFGRDNETKKFELGGSVWKFCCTCCEDVNYPVVNESGVEVGSVVWKFKGFCVQVLTDSDSFVVNFPPEMPVEDKALFIGATLLLDFMYYEHQDNNN